MAVCEVCNSPNLDHGKCTDCGHVQSYMKQSDGHWQIHDDAPGSLQTKEN